MWILMACRPSNDLSERIDAQVATVVHDGVPGLAVAMVNGGRVVHVAGYGLADVHGRRPVTSATVFDIASLAKQFTGAAVLILEAEGRLSRSDDARKYLPELPVFDPARPITVDDLSRHVSGLPDREGGVAEGRRDRPDEVLAWLSSQRALAFPTGSSWRYTNVNYFLLAQIVERVSGQRFAQFVQERIFVPAQMRTAVVVDGPDVVVPMRATGYLADGREMQFDDYLTGPANVFASLADLLAWESALWSGEIVDRDVLLRAIGDGRLEGGSPVPYGVGWSLEGPSGARVAWHDGDWIGASAFVARYVDEGDTVIVLSNVTGVAVRDLAFALPRD